MLRVYSFLGFVMAVTSAQASSFGVQLGSETAQFNYSMDSSSVGYGGADIGLGYFYNESGDFALSAGVKATGTPAAQSPITFGVGANAYYVGIDADVNADASVTAVGVGGEVKYHIPGRMPMALAAEAYFAPPITTSGDADSLSDMNLRFEVEVMPGTVGYVGARYFHVESGAAGGKGYEMDDSVHVGFRMSL